MYRPFNSYFNKNKPININKLRIDYINLEDQGRRYFVNINLDDYKYILLDGPTGKGKTYFIFDLIEKNPHVKVLLICPKKSLGEGFKQEALKRQITYRHYLDDGFNGTFGNRQMIIIQVESTCRIDATDEKIEVVVLDEISSVLKQYNSGLHKNKLKDNMMTFKGIVKAADHVILADAYMKDQIMEPFYKEFFKHDTTGKYKYDVLYQESRDFKARHAYLYNDINLINYV